MGPVDLPATDGKAHAHRGKAGIANAGRKASLGTSIQVAGQELTVTIRLRRKGPPLQCRAVEAAVDFALRAAIDDIAAQRIDDQKQPAAPHSSGDNR